MNNIFNLSKEYFGYALIAWDSMQLKIEDRPENFEYIKNENVKKEAVDFINKARKSGKLRFFENELTSTSYIVSEKPDGEVIIAFRGSDSKVDWIADFLFFKQNFEKYNKELFLSMSNEDFNKLVFDEYEKSIEDTDLSRTVSVFRNTKLVLIDSLIEDSYIKIDSFIGRVFEQFRNKIRIHGGFYGQYISVSSDVNALVDTYISNPKIKKITFVGHSLGSSIAQICMIVQQLRHPLYKHFKSYIYGTPKLGGKKYLDFLIKSKILNNMCITNVKGDICMYLPPNIFGFVENQNTLLLEPIQVDYFTKFKHTLFYYLYCFQHNSPYIINTKYFS